MSQMAALTSKEILAVLKIAAESKRNQAMILLAFKHGMRASEVCELKVCDVDMRNHTITINRLKGSLKSTQDLLDVAGQPLLSERKVLKAWLVERETYGDRSDYLFLSQKGGKLDRSAFFRLYQAVAERAELPANKRHPHCLKHSLGFYLLESGVALPSIQRALGHKSLASTGVYLRVTEDRANRDVAKAFADF